MDSDREELLRLMRKLGPQASQQLLDQEQHSPATPTSQRILECELAAAEKLFSARTLASGEQGKCYIYENQWQAAREIVELFAQGKRAVAVTKEMQMGMSGTMIAIACEAVRRLGTSYEEIFILTGMSNADYMRTSRLELPETLKGKIFHNGTLRRAIPLLSQARNALIMIDEADAANKQNMNLCRTLTAAGVQNFRALEERNIRFLFTSATLLRELFLLYRWGPNHAAIYQLPVTPEYTGVADFHRAGLLQDAVPIRTEEPETIDRVLEEIVSYEEHRNAIHLLRVTYRNAEYVESCCQQNNITFYLNRAEDKEAEDITTAYYEQGLRDELEGQVVIAYIGRLRRGNRIPAHYKSLLGVVHDVPAKRNDPATAQGLLGRLCGYRRSELFDGSGKLQVKTGPWFFDMQSVTAYIAAQEEGLEITDYVGPGIRITEHKQDIVPGGLCDAEEMEHPAPIAYPAITIDLAHDYRGVGYRVFLTQEKARAFVKAVYGTAIGKHKRDGLGREECMLEYSTRGTMAKVRFYTEVITYVTQNKSRASGGNHAPTSFPCYRNPYDPRDQQAVWVIRIRRPNEKGYDAERLQAADLLHPDESEDVRYCVDFRHPPCYFCRQHPCQIHRG